MKKITYYEQLRHPEWQKKRLEILQSADFRCEECGSRENELQVHHSFYLKNKKIWEYDNLAYVCLCQECHKNRASVEKELLETVNNLSLSIREIEALISYIYISTPEEWDKLSDIAHEQGRGASK